MKTCSFCKKDVPRLWYSKPPCCANNYCKEQYRRKKGKPKTKINPFSSKKLSEIAKYRPLRDKYMNEHKHCEAKIRGVCTHYSVDLHHVKSREFFLCDVSVFMAVCRQCHTWIEQNDAEAQKLGFKKANMKDKLEIIKDFEAKTGLKLFDLVDEQVARFDDGRFYAIEDIKYHVENDLDTSLIQEYSDEGTEGCVTETYEIWLAKQK